MLELQSSCRQRLTGNTNPTFFINTIEYESSLMRVCLNIVITQDDMLLNPFQNDIGWKDTRTVGPKPWSILRRVEENGSRSSQAA